MTLLDIINEIDVRTPNTFDLLQKVKWIDLAQKKLYKFIGKKQTHTLLTVDGQELYTLPDNIKVVNITELWIAYTTSSTSEYYEYEYSGERPVYGADSVYYRSDYDGYNQVGIYPVPTTDDLKIKIIYLTIPETLDGSNMLKVPDVNEEFHEMLIADVIMTITMSGDNPDTDLYNVHAQEYNSMNSDMLLSKFDDEPQYPRTKDVMKKGKYSKHGRRKTYFELS